MCNQIENCGICLNDLNEYKTITLRCNHKLHINCGFKWFNINKSCPLCRSKVDIDWIKTHNKLRNKKKIIIEENLKPYTPIQEDNSTFTEIITHIGFLGYSFGRTLIETPINGVMNNVYRTFTNQDIEPLI